MGIHDRLWAGLRKYRNNCLPIKTGKTIVVISCHHLSQRASIGFKFGWLKIQSFADTLDFGGNKQRPSNFETLGTRQTVYFLKEFFMQRPHELVKLFGFTYLNFFKYLAFSCATLFACSGSFSRSVTKEF